MYKSPLTCSNLGLIGYNTNRVTIDSSKTNDYILCILGLNLEKLSFIDHVVNYLMHIIRCGGIIRNNVIQNGDILGPMKKQLQK
jgi:hypothetical protein